MATSPGSARPQPSSARDIPTVLRDLLRDDPGRPRLTWYGPDERVELSAKVLDNWVAKTANLLVEEGDAGPGSRVLVALPGHWRTVCWTLAVWAVGGCVVGRTADAGIPADTDLLVSDDVRLLSHPGTALPIAVALPALATGFGPTLPEGVLDAAAEVRGFGDVFLPPIPAVATDPALELPGSPPVCHGELLDRAREIADRAGWPPHVRLLAGPTGPTGTTGTGPAVGAMLSDVLAPFTRAGSVVLHHDLSGLAPVALARLREQERTDAG